MLLYVGGEGGVGKSQVIKAIVRGMNLIRRKDEVILMAPTGAAVDNIGGNTYHTSLGINRSQTQKPSVSSRVNKLWSRKTIMIINEQMRQAEDPVFRDLLGQARAAALTEEDLHLLNSKVITSLFKLELKDATTVVKLNALRHHINRVQMEQFARSRSQRIYLFPAQHSR